MRPVARAGVRDVELAEHLAQQLGEVVVVGHVGKEACVGLHVARPVDAVHVFHVELLLGLAPHVIEHLRPLGRAVEPHLGAEGQRLGLGLAGVFRDLELEDGSRGQHEAVLALRVEHQVDLGIVAARAADGHIAELLQLLLAQAVDPYLVAVARLRHVVERLAVGRHRGGLDDGRVLRQPLDAVFDVLALDLHRLGQAHRFARQAGLLACAGGALVARAAGCAGRSGSSCLAPRLRRDGLLLVLRLLVGIFLRWSADVDGRAVATLELQRPRYPGAAGAGTGAFSHAARSSFSWRRSACRVYIMWPAS